ncbi:hypothetical protein AMTRI_Chr01g129090 [Amborella trichopoda]
MALFFFSVLSLFFSSLFCTSHGISTVTLKLFHNQVQSRSWDDTLFKMAELDASRVANLLGLKANKTVVPIGSGRQAINTPSYVARVGVGTPPQVMTMLLDTSNDVPWVPCTACPGCAATVFQPTLSTTYKPSECGSPKCSLLHSQTCTTSGSCSFNMTYSDSSFEAALSQDSLSLANDSVPGYSFGCLTKVSGQSLPPQGLLGLGRGSMGLMSQSGPLYKGVFSYCLPNFRAPGFTGSLKLGPVGQPIRIKYTPLLTNPRRSSLYYVKLGAILVGRTKLPIPDSAFAFDPATGSGTVFDSGTMVTRLVAPAYEALKAEFRKRINKTVTTLGGFDTCYNEAIVVPHITFQFEGMNMTLADDNVVIKSSAGSITCLAMAEAPANVNAVVNVIANFQQQNHRVVYDVANGRLGVSREFCS